MTAKELQEDYDFIMDQKCTSDIKNHAMLRCLILSNISILKQLEEMNERAVNKVPIDKLT